jgi:hypothetical protein
MLLWLSLLGFAGHGLWGSREGRSDTQTYPAQRIGKVGPGTSEVVDEGDNWRLEHDYRDSSDHLRHVTCRIRKVDLQKEVELFGYYPAEVNKEVKKQLIAQVRLQIAALGLGKFLGKLRFENRSKTTQDGKTIAESSLAWAWKNRGELPVTSDTEWSGLQKREIAANSFLKTEIPPLQNQILWQAYYKRGFLRRAGGNLEVDYARIASIATLPLEDCFRALAAQGAGASQKLSLLQAFLEDLRYEAPQDFPDGRVIRGFRVPMAVLRERAGDCDSKSAAFCGIWRNSPQRQVLLVSPLHALVGVEVNERPVAKSSPSYLQPEVVVWVGPPLGDGLLEINGVYYRVYEVTGPKKLPPGEIFLPGFYKAVFIEPIGTTAH